MEIEKGEPFYGSYAAQELVQQHKNEVGIEIVPFCFMVFLPAQDRYEVRKDVPEGVEYQTISETELRELLDKGKGIPECFTHPEVTKELEASHPPLKDRGLTLFFTGLSGSGKTTRANGLLSSYWKKAVVQSLSSTVILFVHTSPVNWTSQKNIDL